MAAAGEKKKAWRRRHHQAAKAAAKNGVAASAKISGSKAASAYRKPHGVTKQIGIESRAAKYGGIMATENNQASAKGNVASGGNGVAKWREKLVVVAKKAGVSAYVSVINLDNHRKAKKKVAASAKIK